MLELPQQPWLLYLTAAVIGLILGSFATVLIHRLPLILEGDHKLSLALPPSHCPKCQSPIPYYFNIPLLGYILRGGRCHQCHKSISLLYPITEGLCMLLACSAVWLWGAELKTLSAALLWCGLLTLSIIDYRSGYLPDQLTLGLIWLGLLFNTMDLWVPTTTAVWGACLGYLILFSINGLYKIIRHRDGIGGGDMKLYAALGAFLGWQSLIPILSIASITGCIFAIYWLSIKKQQLTQIAFGPFLALAGFIYMLYERFYGDLPWI